MDYRKQSLDTGWRQAETGAAIGDYEPMIIVSVNVARLRRCFEKTVAGHLIPV